MHRIVSSTPSALGLIIVTAVHVAAQEPNCGGVSDNCEINGNPACWIEAGQEFGSVRWEFPSGCLVECPDPEHCGPEFAQQLSEMGTTVAAFGSFLLGAIDRNDRHMLQDLLNSERVTFNVERRAIQVHGCTSDVVIGHLRVPEHQVALLQVLHNRQQRLASVSSQ
ncbi:MAG TPA: hypothetical protein VMN60_10930 [Longimicrobiales bacterium]|nr:hypothetical protein [Longimicrobiales bacterium]